MIQVILLPMINAKIGIKVNYYKDHYVTMRGHTNETATYKPETHTRNIIYFNRN